MPVSALSWWGLGLPLLVSHGESSLPSWTLIPGGLTAGLRPPRARTNPLRVPCPDGKQDEVKRVMSAEAHSL